MATDVRLLNDVTVTAVPSGRKVLLSQGSLVTVTQALGGMVTVRDGGGIYQVEGDAINALGDEIAAQVSRSGPAVAADEPFSEDQVWQALKTCFDPEIPLNIVDLGLVYDVAIEAAADGRHDVHVRMTLTAVGCGMGPAIAGDAQRKIEALPGVHQARVEVVWDPQWTPHMISAEGRQVLGLE